MPLTLVDPVRGVYTLTERQELALRSVAMGYRWIAHVDGLGLLFLGLVDRAANGVTLSDYGTNILAGSSGAGQALP